MATLTTSSGYVVEFKDELDTKGYRAIQKANLKGAQLHPGMDKNDIAFAADVMFDAEEVALTHMLVSVTLPDGAKAASPVAAVGEMPFADGEEVYQKLNELTAPKESEEETKKDSAASSAT